MRPWTGRTVALGIIGLVFIFAGAAVYLFRISLYNVIIQNALSLSPKSHSYEMWKNTSSIPTHLNIYFFNWTNPEEITDFSKKPNLVQLGPYSFLEKREKVNITFHPENNTVSYLQKRTWFFDQSKSNGTLNDTICHLNVVAVSAAYKIRYWPFVMQQSLSYLLNQFSNKIHITKTVDELLFKGYEDELITLGKAMDFEEDAPPYDKFGWFYLRNGSSAFDGYSNIATGADDIANLGKLKMWNYKDTTSFYKTPCNVVEGSAGEFWPPKRTKDEIKLFTPDICRPVTYEYEDTVMHKGIEGYKYSLGKKTLSNDTKRLYPHEHAKYFEPTTTTEEFFDTDMTTLKPTYDDYDNPDMVNEGHCYCNGECSPMGVINITACRYGAPGFISLPHFHKADPVLRNRVNGLNPNDKDHSFYLTLEPTTGIPIDVAARLQVNILLTESKVVTLFKDVPRIYMPIFWFSMKAGIPDDMVDGMKFLLNMPEYFMYTGLGLMLIGSFTLFGVAVACYVNNSRRLPQNNSKKLKSSQKKTEMMVYMDTMSASDDTQARSDRKLYPQL